MQTATTAAMAAKKTKPGYDYIVAALQKNKKASYADIAAAAKKKGLSVYPVMYGRAKAALGLVGSKQRKTASSKSKPATRGAKRASGGSKSARVRELLEKGMSAANIATKVGCTTGLVYQIKSSSGTTAKRGPGRPRKPAGNGSLDGLTAILALVKDSQNERLKMRAALERIRDAVDAVLA